MGHGELKGNRRGSKGLPSTKDKKQQQVPLQCWWHEEGLGLHVRAGDGTQLLPLRRRQEAGSGSVCRGWSRNKPLLPPAQDKAPLLEQPRQK